jgi:hypothetical protein
MIMLVAVLSPPFFSVASLYLMVILVTPVQCVVDGHSLLVTLTLICSFVRWVLHEDVRTSVPCTLCAMSYIPVVLLQVIHVNLNVSHWPTASNSRVQWCRVVYSGAQWYIVVYGGVQWCTAVRSGVQWYIVVYGGVQWCTAVRSGVQWCTAVRSGVQWYIVV